MGLSGCDKKENPGCIFLHGFSRAAGDPCCSLGCKEAKSELNFLKDFIYLFLGRGKGGRKRKRTMDVQEKH